MLRRLSHANGARERWNEVLYGIGVLVLAATRELEKLRCAPAPVIGKHGVLRYASAPDSALPRCRTPRNTASVMAVWWPSP